MPTYTEFRQRQMEYIEQSLKDDRKRKQEMAKVYRSSLEDIQRHIDADIQKFAHKEGVSMAEAKKIISKTDVEKFQSTAKKYVEEEKFTPKANKELRRYNITMRSNRLELLQARINLDIIALALEEEQLTGQHIAQETIAEYERQAGILAMSAPSQAQLNTLATAVALSDVSGATFSDRIWANQVELRNEVNQTIERALIRGEHPRKSATNIKRLIRDEYGKKQRAAERILITETARAQTIAGVEAFKKAEVDQYVYIAEPSACDICSKLDDKVFDVKDMAPGENASPMHPHCRCAIAGYVSDESETTVETPEPEVSNVEKFDLLNMDSVEEVESEERVQEVINRTKRVVESYKSETGIDIIELHKNKAFHDKNNPYDDEHAKFTKYMMKRTGYDGVPQVLDDVSGLHDIYRGISDSEDGSIKAANMLERFNNGPIDISGAKSSTYGRAIYFGDDVGTAQSYAEKGINGDVIEAYITKEAKMMDYEMFKRNGEYFKENIDKFGDDADYYNLVNGGNWLMDKNYEMLAMLHGYDGMEMSGGFFAIYNRSALGVKK